MYPQMQYRQLGATQKEVSIIGLGAEQLDKKPYEVVKPTIDAALDAGINIMDVFMPGKEVRENIAKALGTRRKDVMIQGHIGSTDVSQQYDITRDLPTVKKYFEDMLRIFGGYIDFGMLFFIDSEKDYKGVFETGFAEYVQDLKKNGYIGHIGFSSHSPQYAQKAIETGVPEMMMFSINMAFDAQPPSDYTLDMLDNGFSKEHIGSIQPERAALYRLCEQRNIGITVMKALGSGKLISAEHSPFSPPLTVPQCTHYALSRPAVSSVLLGAQTPQEIAQAVSYLDTSAAERDYTSALQNMKKDFAGHCVYCGHCQPCPAQIDIAAVHRYLDIALLDEDNIPPSIVSHYKAMPRSGIHCLPCGGCEKRCPFGVSVIKNMSKAVNLFGK